MYLISRLAASSSDDRNVSFPNQQDGNATNGGTLFLQVGFSRHGSSYLHGADQEIEEETSNKAERAGCSLCGDFCVFYNTK